MKKNTRIPDALSTHQAIDGKQSIGTQQHSLKGKTSVLFEKASTWWLAVYTIMFWQ